ncbi:hypothetical protein AKJ16_DCAP17815 [Drosera capensis]
MNHVSKLYDHRQPGYRALQVKLQCQGWEMATKSSMVGCNLLLRPRLLFWSNLPQYHLCLQHGSHQIIKVHMSQSRRLANGFGENYNVKSLYMIETHIGSTRNAPNSEDDDEHWRKSNL